MDSTIRAVTGGFNIYPPSKPICSTHDFSPSTSMTSCSFLSCRGSNWSCLAIFYACTAFSSVCRLFIFASVLIFYGNDIVLCHCFNSVITACIISSLSYRYCKLPSYKSFFHSWSCLSNDSVILCMVCSILSADSVASCYHCALTYRGLVGIENSSNSFIWSLYYSKASCYRINL